MDVKVTVIARVLALIVVLINQWLSNKGVSPIPIDEATLITMGTALITAWKDNPFTEEAKRSNEQMKQYKAEAKYNKARNGKIRGQ